MSKKKRQCVSSQNMQATENTPLNSNHSNEMTSTVNSQNSGENSTSSQRKHADTKRKAGTATKKFKKEPKTENELLNRSFCILKLILRKAV